MRKPIIAVVSVFLLSARIVFAGLSDISDTLNSSIVNSPLHEILPDLAKVLNVDPALLRKAMVDSALRLSDVACAKFMSEKTGQPITDFFKIATPLEWVETLTRYNLKEKDAADYLDVLQTEVAFMMLDHRTVPRKRR